MTTLIFIILLLGMVVLLSALIGMRHGFIAMSSLRIRDKAQKGNKDAKHIYPFFAQKERVEVLLITSIVLLELCIVLFLQSTFSTFGAFLMALGIYLLAEFSGRAYFQQYSGFFMAKTAPIFQKVLALTAPYNKFIANFLKRRTILPKKQMSRLEILEIIHEQSTSVSGGINKVERHMLEAILQFNNLHISEVMTPRRAAKTVKQDDEIGPVLMDELYSSGYSRFPVVAGSSNQSFVGTLYMRDLIGSHSQKRVKDVMSKDVRYVHEDQSLEHALHAFLRTRHHIFIVVNSFEEFVGLLTIEDVLEALIGSEIVDEFDEHDDIRKVASMYAKQEHQIHANQEGEKK